MGVVFHCQFVFPGFYACSHFYRHYSYFFLSYMYVHPAYFVQFFPCWFVVSGKPHRSAFVIYSRVSQLVVWAKGFLLCMARY